MSRQIADGLSQAATATAQDVLDGVAGKYTDASEVKTYVGLFSAGPTPSDTTQTGVLTARTVWLADSSAVRSRDLPASPAEDDTVQIVDNTGSARTNNLTIGRNGNTIMGLAEDLVIDVDRANATLKYISGDWRLV